MGLSDFSAKPERDHIGVGHRAATGEVLALVHDVLIGDKFTGICCGRLKLVICRRDIVGRRRLMMTWRRTRRCLVIVALIALARRYGLHNQHWNK